MRHILWLAFLSFCLLSHPALAWAAPSAPSDFPSREEVLASVFPGAEIRSERVFLTQEQQERAAALARVEIPSRLIARYLAFRQGRPVGRAYVDTHVVRTKKESLLVCLGPDGKVRHIEVTAFLEPREYQASPAWYSQFYSRDLQDDLRLQGAIRSLAGATLTALAANQAVRRVLAIDRVLLQPGKQEQP